MRKLAVVVSGWHFPLHFYKKISQQKLPSDWEAEFFCISHRDPSYAAEEKKKYISGLGGSRREIFDAIMYSEIASRNDLEKLGWKYFLEPNTVGDWGNTNQWLEKNDYRKYDLFLFSHDDNFILNNQLFVDAIKMLEEKNWLVLTNSVGPPPITIRGSFEFFSREMMDMIGGKFDLSMITLNREGKFTTDGTLSELGNWNKTVTPLADFIEKNGLQKRIFYLSPYYRMSHYCLEGERGIINSTYKLNTNQEERGLDEVEKDYPNRFKKIVYLANVSLFDDWAHTFQIMKMCEAFVENEFGVELVIQRRHTGYEGDIFDYYNIKNKFKIVRLPCIDFFPSNPSRLLFLLRTFSFLAIARIYLFFKKYDILYTRSFYTGLFFKNYNLELHFLPERIKNRHVKFFKRAKRIVVLTSLIKKELILLEIPEDKILIAPDGVDLEEFDINVSKEEAWEKLNLPKNKKIILYSGSLYFYDWKGVDVLLEAIKYLPNDYSVVLLGGEKDEVEKIKKLHNSGKLVLAGRKEHREIPYYLKAADVLVLPNKKGDANSEKYTSPLKLFEYMVSGVPIVASDLPSIREILNENNAVLVEPNNPAALAEGIKKTLQNPGLSDKISRQAFYDIQNYTWGKRVERVLNFIKR